MSLKDTKSRFSDTVTEEMRAAKGELDTKLLPDASPYQINRVQSLNYNERATTDEKTTKTTRQHSPQGI